MTTATPPPPLKTKVRHPEWGVGTVMAHTRTTAAVYYAQHGITIHHHLSNFYRVSGPRGPVTHEVRP